MTEKRPQAGETPRPKAAPEKQLTPKEAREKRDQSLFGKRNAAIHEIEVRVNKHVRGDEAGVKRIREDVVAQSTHILTIITNKTITKLNAAEALRPEARARTEIAKILKAFEAMLKRRVEGVNALIEQKMADNAEIGKMRDSFVGVTEIAQDKTLSSIYTKISKGTPLNDEELNHIVERTSASSLTAKANKEGVGEIGRKYLQVALGPILDKMNYKQKVEFADKFIRAKGAVEFLKLAEVMTTFGALKPGQYRDLMNTLRRRTFNTQDAMAIRSENIRLHDENYLKQLTERAEQFKEIYRKKAIAMRIRPHQNALDTITAGGVLKVAGMAWGSVVGVFNALASFSNADGSIPEKVIAVVQNPYFFTGAGLTTYLALDGGKENRKEKLTPEFRPQKKEIAKKEGQEYLAETYNNNPELHDFLIHGGMESLIQFNRLEQKRRLTKEGIKPETIDGEMKITKRPLAKVSAERLIEFIKTENPVNNSLNLANRLTKLTSHPSYKTNLDKKLNNTMLAAKKAGIRKQKDYNSFINHYKKNRGSYEKAKA